MIKYKSTRTLISNSLPTILHFLRAIAIQKDVDFAWSNSNLPLAQKTNQESPLYSLCSAGIWLIKKGSNHCTGLKLISILNELSNSPIWADPFTLKLEAYSTVFT